MRIGSVLGCCRIVGAVIALLLAESTNAQALRTFGNGEVADADDINHNFNVLNDSIANAANSGPFNPSKHVTLRTAFSDVTGCPNDRAYFRVNLDGTTDTSEFIVPAGHTLFLTDISWQALDSPATFASGRTLAMLLIASDVNGSNAQTVYFSPKTLITTASENSLPGRNESLTSGVAIGAGRKVCATVSSNGPSSAAFHTVTNSVLRGFLVPN